MKMKFPAAIVLGSVFCAAAASAQTDTARTKPVSTSRIPISKESPAPMPPRVDTVTVYHTDTVTKMRTDTLTITRVDTIHTASGEVVTTTPVPTLLRQIGGLYIGVDGGAAVPSGDRFNSAQSTGWHIDVPIGWDPVGSPLGLRVTGGYSHFDTKNVFEPTNMDSPQIFQGDADLKLRLPMTSALSHRVQLYAIGGATYNRFKNVLQRNDNGSFTIGDATGVAGVNGGIPTTIDSDWHSAWGWNAGGGVQFGWGRTNLFVESRYTRFNRNGDLSQVPVVVGLSWF
jgi:hypothetical protein